MGRDATKAAGNPWYQARKKAAEYDDRLWHQKPTGACGGCSADETVGSGPVLRDT